MSKSAADSRSRILLSDSRDEIASKIRKAVTDSEGHISYDPAGRPGVSNLLRILYECKRISALSTLPRQTLSLEEATGLDPSASSKEPQPSSASDLQRPESSQSDFDGDVQQYHAGLSSLASSFDGLQTSQFKEAVVHAVDSCLSPIRAELLRLRADESYLRDVAHEGAGRARQRASQTMKEVRACIGLD